MAGCRLISKADAPIPVSAGTLGRRSATTDPSGNLLSNTRSTGGAIKHKAAHPSVGIQDQTHNISVVRLVLLGTVILMALLSAFPTCGSANEEEPSLGTTEGEIRRKLDEKLRKGSTPSEVLAVLDEFKVDHSDYLTHPVLDGGLAAVLGRADRFAPVNVRHIGAIVRDVKKSFLISESIQIFFLFDEHDNLVEYKFKRIATGL